MSHGDHLTRNRGPIRALLVLLGVPQGLIGLWALLAPRSFYDGFPFGTDGWVNPLGPFDEHLVRDVGALFVGLAVLTTVAAVRLRRPLVTLAAAVWLIFAVPHTIWHVANLEPFGTADAIANAATLAWTVVGGALVLALARAPRVAPRADATTDGDGPRIEGVPDGRAGLIARGSYSYSRRTLGEVTEPTRVFAHHPTILAGYGALELATRRADRLPERLKHLVATKTAALVGCEWCMDIGSMLSTESGVTEAQLRALPDHARSEEFSELEKLALDLAVAMTRTPADISDGLFHRLAERLDEAQLVELVNEIALENYRARFNWAFGIGSQGFAAGGVCVRPETATAQRSVREKR